MSKKKRRENRQRKEKRRRWLPYFKTVKGFLRKNWIAITGIVVGAIVAFVGVYLTIVEPDIRYIGDPNATVEVLDEKTEGNKHTSIYRVAFRFKNLSIKSGYVSKVEFIPVSLSPASTVKVIDVEKVQIGWREEKVIYVKWLVIDDYDANRAEQEKGVDLSTYEQRAYDNTGKQIPDMSGNFKQIMKKGIRTGDYSPPQQKAAAPQFEPTQ